jgi:putative DNA primase/helicase
MITRITSIAPAETSDCPLWKKFLDDTTGGDKALIRFLQQWLGYTLTGITREHALVFIHGSGGNGKSVFLTVVAEIFGDYAVTASMDTFTASSFERHTADLAMLCGARLVTASETESGKPWAESRIKQMTGGDAITARFMRQNFFTYTPQFKLTIVGNHEPALRNVDEATERRFNIVPFTRKPPTPDKALLQKLRAEHPAILRWMIEGCLDWQSNGLIRPEAVTSATADYFEGQDLIGQWLEEKCDLGPGDDGKRDTVNLLFASWINFAELAGEKPGSKKTFGDVLVKRGVRRHKGAGGVRYMLGVTLKPGARPHSSRSTTTL